MNAIAVSERIRVTRVARRTIFRSVSSEINGRTPRSLPRINIHVNVFGDTSPWYCQECAIEERTISVSQRFSVADRARLGFTEREICGLLVVPVRLFRRVIVHGDDGIANGTNVVAVHVR